MKSKFALSFGIALIFVGLLNIFFNMNAVAIFGLTISSFSFSIITFILLFINKEKYEWLYVFPFILFISILSYGDSLIKLDFMQQIINSNLNNGLCFFSFGLLFISEYAINKHNIKMEKFYFASVINENIDCIDIIIKNVSELRKKINNNESIQELPKFFDNIKNFCYRKVYKAKLELDLLETNKNEYDLKEIDQAYENVYNYIESRKKLKKNK